MEYTPINLKDKFSQLDDLWSPRIVAAMNDYHIKLAKIQGEFVWHEHAETDEVFVVIQGRLEIHLRDGVVRLGEGEMFVVPRGTEHKPVAAAECQIMLIEPAGTLNTGGVVTDRTRREENWI